MTAQPIDDRTAPAADIRRPDLSEKRRRLLDAMLGTTTPVAADRITPASRGGPLPLSPAQQRLWTLDRLISRTPLYNAPLAYRLRGRLDREALAEALTRLVARHEVLRTTFSSRNGVPEQVIRPAQRVPVTLVHVASNGARPGLADIADREAKIPFDLEQGPLFRVSLVPLGDDDTVLLLTFHHILTDTWSLGVMFRELAAEYDRARGVAAPDLPPLPVQYADFAVWQRESLIGERTRRDLDYWTEQLRDAPRMLTLPTDRPAPVMPTFAGATHEFTVPAGITARLRALATAHDATLFMVLLAGFAATLARYTGQTDVVVCSPVAGRSRVELEHLIGFFVNNLLLRIDLSGDPAFTEVLRRVRRTALAGYDHQDLPFETLVEALKPERHLGRQPLAQISFQVAEPVGGEAEFLPSLAGVTVEPMATHTGTSKFDLSIAITAHPDGLRGTVEYATELYDPATIERFTANFGTLLESVADLPERPVHTLPAVAEPQLRQLITEWNRTEHPISAGPCLHDLVEATVRRNPEAVAVVADTVELTYRELDQRANGLAHRLRANGVTADDLVCLLADRSPATVVAQLAILKAGGAYLPLDPDQPPQRLAALITDSGAGMLLVQRGLLDAVPSRQPATVVAFDEVEPGAPKPPPRISTADNLAYGVFTSGSTGRPKCVVTPHRGIVNMLEWARHEYRMTPADRMVHKAPYSFDVSVWEVFWPLVYGGAVVIARPGGQRDARYLARLVKQHQVSTIHFVPTMLRAFMAVPAARDCDRLRQVICGGEPLTTDLVADFYAAFPEGVTLHNQYGPAEVSVQTTTWPLDPGCRRVVLGRGVWNTRLYVLDTAGLPVPVGVTGELYLAGVQLARGYLGQPGLTADRFVPDPYGPPGSRAYRSGDLVRRLPDGTLEFAGRADYQVKIGGHRIEPGEVQTRLAEHPSVGQAVVVALPVSSNAKQLVAYVVVEPGREHDRLESVLRTHLAERLPSYLVPTWIVVLDALPLNHNGKVDVSALRPPHPGDRPEHVPPRTDTELALSRIWEQVLRLDRVGADDNFFTLGGDSIRAIEVVARAQGEGLELTPNQIFQYQTIGELALVAIAEAAAGPRSRPETALAGPAVVTPMQRLYLQTGGRDEDSLAQYVCLTVPARLGADDLDRAIGQLIQRHPALRTRYRQTAGTWTQEVMPSRQAALLNRIRTGADLDDAAEAWVREAVARLRPSEGRLVEGALVSDGDSHLLVLMAHHLGVDAVSWRILVAELETLCREPGRAVELPVPTTSFIRWSEGLAARAARTGVAEEAFWRDRLAVPVPRLPRDRTSAEAPAYGTARRFVLHVSKEVTDALTEVGRTYRVRPHEIFIAATVAALRRWTGAEQIRVDLEGHGREDVLEGVDVTRTVGWFTSLYPLVVANAGIGDAAAELVAVKEELHRTPDRGLGFGWVAGNATGEYLFNFLGSLDGDGAPGSLLTPVGEPLRLAATPSRPRTHLIESDAYLTGDGALVRWLYEPAIHDEVTIRTIAAHFAAFVDELVELSRLPGAAALTAGDFPLSGLTTAELSRHFGPGHEVQDIYPLSAIQEGLLFHTLTAPDAAMYLTQASWELGDVHAPTLAAAWQEIVRRTPVLRTRLSWQTVREPMQVVEREVRLPVEVLNWAGRPAGEQAHALDQLLADGRRDPLALDRAPLLRITLIRTASANWRIVLECHHVLLDGWSVVMLLADVLTAYRRLRFGADLRLPARPAFRHYIDWQRRTRNDQDRDYWIAHLEGVTGPTPLPIGPPPGGAGQGALDVPLPTGFAGLADAFARREQITQGTLLQGAWALALARYQDAGDVVFGVTVSGRSGLPGIELMIGLLINTLPLRVRVNRDEPVGEWLRALQAERAQMPSEHTSLAQVKSWSGFPARAPLFDSILVIENYPMDENIRSQLGGLSAEVLRVEETISYPIRVLVAPGASIEIQLRYDRARVAPEHLAALAANLGTALTVLADGSAGTVSGVLKRLSPYPSDAS
ncbi:amino acid adenylation domain-containing protein [Micromonospora sp. NPDC047557]|uniref:amino acid adenylation domain-containing protein n=1 Tax=Micromonospora sp. NPDC047557 TaxID=3364250 RepID=UPI00371EE3BC